MFLFWVTEAAQKRNAKKYKRSFSVLKLMQGGKAVMGTLKRKAVCMWSAQAKAARKSIIDSVHKKKKVTFYSYFFCKI